MQPFEFGYAVGQFEKSANLAALLRGTGNLGAALRRSGPVSSLLAQLSKSVAPDAGVAVNAAGKVMSSKPISALDKFRRVAAGQAPVRNAAVPPTTYGMPKTTGANPGVVVGKPKGPLHYSTPNQPVTFPRKPLPAGQHIDMPELAGPGLTLESM